MKLSQKQACLLASFAVLPTLVQGETYSVFKEYSGTTFFNGWDFYGSFDNLTNGDVNFITASQNVDPTKLAYVDPTTNRAIIKVDNTTKVPWNEKRNTVRITTSEAYNIGSVIIADIYHAPYGCSVWPSFWTWAAAEEWPVGGEIDVFEGINRATRSQMGLHTAPGCSQVSPKQTTTEVRTADCAGENNSGCIVANTDAASFGTGFAAAGGGLFITEFAASGISIWFFSRANIPASITADAQSVDTSTLGTPMGNWPAAGCDISKFFRPQNLVFTITLCGDFAGKADIFQQTCEGKCYDDFVIKDPSVYDTAYFDIASVRVFSNETRSSTSSALPSGTSAVRNSTASGPSSSAVLSRPLQAIHMIGLFVGLGALLM